MVLRSGWDHGIDEPGTVEVCAQEAYEEAGLGPNDVNVIECHDASAPAELMAYESLGLCAKGEGGALVDSGATRLGGRIPVNTSGGLLRKGHPVGATGIAQIVELTEQLQGRSGKRQVATPASVSHTTVAARSASTPPRCASPSCSAIRAPVESCTLHRRAGRAGRTIVAAVEAWSPLSHTRGGRGPSRRERTCVNATN